MSLTVKEKEHWKDRIARRIDHAIEELQATEDPVFFERIRKKADEQSWASLGLKELREEREKVADDRKRLEDRERELWAEMASIVSGEPVENLHRSYCQPHEVSAAIKRRRLVHERELLSQSELGKKIQHLLAEKEELLDTVWLASSPSQIKELWSRFAEVLNWEPPKLQQEALTIPPLSSES